MDQQQDRDPVCGMTVKPDSPPHTELAGRTWRFCSKGCREKFIADPSRYTQKQEPPRPAQAHEAAHAHAHERGSVGEEAR